MKILITLSIFVVAIGAILVGNSYGQVAAREDPSLPEVSLQLALRNSDGQLVAYVEPTVMFIRNVGWTHEYLDTIENKTIITRGGQNYELVQFTSTASFSSIGQKSTYGMVSHGTHVLLFRHDGFIAAPGDTLDVSWRIIRTIR